MKIHVITDAQGEVVATARATPSGDAQHPFGGCPVPEAGHQLHEIELPESLHHVVSAHELHRELSRMLKGRIARG